MVNVSVIIPSYNGDRYIQQAINSILAQTYPNYEIVIVDDGSTDNTKQILHANHNKIRYCEQSNQGVGAARNRGLELARGEFIAFLDQDDFFLPHKLTSQVALLQAKPSLGIVNSGWQIVNNRGEKLAAITPWQHLPILDLAGILVWKPVFLGAMLFRRHWLEKAGGFSTSLEQTPDVDLLLRLALLGCPAEWLPQVTVGYRQHDRNASRNTYMQARELEIVLDRAFSRPNLASEVRALEAESRYQSLVWSAWRLYQTGYLCKMAEYLVKSFAYRRKSPTETIMHWVERFKNYATEYGEKIDVYALTSSPEWQKAIAQCLFTKNLC